MPAWQVPPAEGNGTTWAVLVHGHGSTRGEALRVIPLLRELGLTSLAITYRNDVGAPPSADRMRHLGADEWEDAESAISFALEHGARRIVLMGWSMGGGIALRTSVLSRHREAIAALVLDSPAVDWRDILIHQARALGAPRPMRELALWMMTSPWGRHLVHLHEPLALAQMHPEFYAEHLAHRTLLIHALEDTTVPPTPSRHLAELRPDLVDFVPVPGASHTREWNRDPAAYETMLARWLVDELDLEVDPADLPVPLRDPGAAPLPGSTGRRI
jgi:pimeloyl-ACP methyl ester carboxylesterase